MPDVGFTNLLGVLVVALVAPAALGFVPRLRVPAVVLEIVLGVVLGPDVLGWLEPDLVVSIVSLLGLAMLLFLAGLEVDVHQLRGRLLGVAVLGYLVSLAVGWVAGLGLDAVGWVHDPLLLAVTLSATSLGLVVAVLKDARQVDSPLGQTTLAASSLADFAAVLLLSLLFSSDMSSTTSRLVLLAVFVGLVAVTGTAAALAGRSRRLGEVVTRLQDTSAELRVRAAMVLLIAFVVLAEHVGLESILGAFLAGATVSLVDADARTHPHFRIKLEAIGFGFLIPVFFVTSGMRLEVSALLDHPDRLAQVPVFLLALLAARGVPALLYLPRFGARSTAAAALLQATSLPFIVTATQIGMLTGRLSTTTGTALVCAGLVSVLVFPAAAIALIARVAPGTTDAPADGRVDP